MKKRARGLKQLSRSRGTHSGVALLPLVLGLSFVLMTIVISMTMMSYSETTIGTGQRRANEAFFLADAGVSDAMILLSRNKSFSHAGYTITLGNGSVLVAVEQNQPIAGQARITSTGTVSDSKRRIQVVVNISTYGKVTISSWSEIAP